MAASACSLCSFAGRGQGVADYAIGLILPHQMLHKKYARKADSRQISESMAVSGRQSAVWVVM
jgi:hypothetical protein